MTSKDKTACFCHHIKLEDLEAWVKQNPEATLPSLRNNTSAGEGPCGASCLPILLSVLRPSDLGTKSSKKPPVPADFLKALSHLNRKYYWETHEILEHLWLDEVGETKLFYQAVIQGAAALYHVLNTNPRGVIKLSQDSLAKFRGPTENPWEIDFSPLISALKSYRTQAEAMESGDLQSFDFSLLPKVLLPQGLVLERDPAV